MTRTIICLTMAVLAIGCKKKEEVAKTIDPEMKRYFSFQPGTYWIYKDSVSGKEDSFYVSQNTTTTTDGIEYSNALITIHNYTSVPTCSISLHQTGLDFKFADPQVGFGLLMLGGVNWINITTLSVGGTTYDSVRKTEIEGAYYLRHNVGLLKIAPNKGPMYKVWELQRYHIVK